MNGSNCMPASWREDSDLFVSNIILIVLVGASGSAFTLTAVPYAAFKLGDRFLGVWTYTTNLLLHISLCDLLYCLLGLPMFVVVTYREGLLYSDHFCYAATVVRNMIAVADFYTVAAIALSRTVGILRKDQWKLPQIISIPGPTELNF